MPTANHRGTAKFVDEVYFAALDTAGQLAPATSELGVHENLDETTILLIGETKGPSTWDVRTWRRGFLLFHSLDFREASGYLYKNHDLILHLERAWTRKRDDVLKRSYWNLTDTPVDAHVIRERVREFFSSQTGSRGEHRRLGMAARSDGS